MILETVRIIADALGRGDLEKTGGVNVNILSLGLDPEDERPTPVRQVADETRDNWAARKNTPPGTPVIVVTNDAPFEMEAPIPTGHHRDSGDISVAIRYIRQDYETAQAVADTLYTLRAIVMSLTDLLQADQSDRTRNNVCIVSIPFVTQLLVTEDVGEAAVTGAVLVTCQVRDLAP